MPAMGLPVLKNNPTMRFIWLYLSSDLYNYMYNSGYSGFWGRTGLTGNTQTSIFGEVHKGEGRHRMVR